MKMESPRQFFFGICWEMAGAVDFFSYEWWVHFFGIQRSQKQMQLSGSIWMNMDEYGSTDAYNLSSNQPNADAYSMS